MPHRGNGWSVGGGQAKGWAWYCVQYTPDARGGCAQLAFRCLPSLLCRLRPLPFHPHSPASTQVLSPSEAVKIVCDHLAEGYSAAAAASELCREAVRLASSVRHAGEGAQADNTTAAVLAFPEL